ncbi:MAG: hypothetical protein KatS3mg038_2198 [Candidatus Kapaibacterium sp.]|nr:MAG: hypothetical protein KatS3mg038_0756 [Candidatus Kapabacteria bacterium]GIV50962.1 MAG: hypothetical protein KatS3mg038_1483 [Candidatus Kapabacteria bacterium]GIV51677.1 MAG: hypothetical protein KatS3mg038_2198 [Candidatus Kapabacteria bacterium]
MDATIMGLDEHLDVRISADIRQAAATLTPTEARWIVKMYYTLQDYRIRAAHQVRTAREAGEPNACLTWMFRSIESIEKQIVPLMRTYVRQYRVGQWLLAQYGVGPVISAVCLTSFDVSRAPAAGNFWSFAGLSPSIKWERGQKRPYNAFLKSAMAYRLGEVFVKFSNREQCLYGHLYKRKKEELIAQNEAGAFAAYATKMLQEKKYRTDTGAYEALSQGRLPQGQIHARARRFAVKIFLSHLHAVMYEDYYGRPAPRPYVVEFLHHKDVIAPLYWPKNAAGENYVGKGIAELLCAGDDGR